MAQETIGQNITFDIYNADGTSFNGLVLHKSTWESVVMSLGDKITGDVYYPTNALVVTMQEYIVYKGVKYSLVNPPTIVREGMASDNSELKGMTKYSFTFYHPMYMLANFPFSDVAVSSDQQRYLSENKTFYWIGNLVDYVAKLNKNLQGTEWCVEIGITVPSEEQTKLSEVLSFDKQTIADALKTGYETWEVPYVIDTIDSTDSRYAHGKRFLVHFGLPSEEILVENEQHELVPYVFRFGQGVGLKNNSRTPRNNKIVTRISGYGSENNIPYGYPQILWTGNQSWDFTINNDSDDPHSYPIYDGIMNGQPVRLIKHPFTRSTLMPSIYSDTVNRKVNPYATGYDPTIEIKDYYDADNTYENPINPLSPSYEIHEFEKIKPELGEKFITGVAAYNDKDQEAITLAAFLNILDEYYTESEFIKEKEELDKISSTIGTMQSNSGSVNTRSYYCDWSFTKDDRYAYVKFDSSSINFEYTVLMVSQSQNVDWDDSMDGDGNYKQSYFKITIPQLDFDLYACAAVTQEMKINMRSGACLGCSFTVAVDWEDYKANFYDEDGDFAPDGAQRDFEKYPDSSQGSITLIVQKDTETFGTLMPNRYQKPAANDKFVILGISLPYTYVTNAEGRLDADMKQYMRDNNVYYFDYPLKFDEHFLATHTGILEQMKPNIVVRFEYAGTVHALYIKQMSVKFWQSPLPQYDITLTDDVEIVLNQIGRVTDEVSNLRLLFGGGGGTGDINNLDQRYLSKIKDDKANGLITLIRGLQVGSRYVSGLLGEGGIFRKEADGTTYIEADKLYIRMRAYFDTVEVKRYLHSGGNRIASKAGIKCTRVEYIDGDGNVTNDADEAVKFRCYFRADDNGVVITNDFEVNDLAFCRETNVDTTSVDMHSYWRKVVGVGNVVTDDGELYIDLSATDCQSGSDIPLAQDDIIQLGNATDTTRQGAIVEFVGGADAPSYQIFQNINTYSLEGKNYISLGYNSGTGRAYLNVYGDTFIGAMPDEYGNSPTYLKYNAGTRSLEIKAKIDAQSTIDGETLAEFIAQNTWTEEQIDALITAGTEPLEDAIEEIQRQVDGSIATWFYDGVPTLNNPPASGWTTADLKNEHLGDLYYDNLTGYAYRFKYDDTNHQWSWGRITDVDVIKALADAAKAQDTADHKRRIFVVQPTPPYDQGDLWVNATYPSGNTETNAAQNKYYNDVLRCNTTKASGTSFAIADWGLASKYTDDQALEDFKANQYVTQLTNGTLSQNVTNAQNAATSAQGTASSALTQAQAAEAHAAAFDAIKQALDVDNRTIIDGGLVLSTLIALRDSSGTLWSGISGAYSTSGAYGGGLAAWFGGGFVDRRNSDGTWNNVGAKVGFRFDGSGYVAGGAISWDATGLTKVTASKISALEIDLNGDEVATENWVSSNFVSITFFERLFQAYNGSTIVHPNSTSTIDNIKAMFGFWTEQYISALGQGSGGGSGAGDVTWDLLASSSDSRPIALSHLSSALTGGGYSTQSWVQSYVGGLLGDYVSVIYMNNSSAHWSPTNGELNLGNIVKQVKVNGTTYSPNMNGVADLGTISGGGGTVTAVKVGTTTYNPTSGVVSLPAYPTVPTNVSAFTNDAGYTTNIGTVTQVKVGTTAYNPSSGVVSLPAYPTTLPASDVYSWAKASTKPSYSLDEVSDGSTRKLANYLPLSGGKLTGLLKIKGEIPSHFASSYLSSLYINNDLQIGWATLIHAASVEMMMCATSGEGLLIRTTSSTAELMRCIGNQTSLGSGGSDVFSVKANGLVGINTSSPSYSLHTVGNALISYTDSYPLTLTNTGSSGGCGMLLNIDSATKGITLYSSDWGMSIINFTCVKALGILDNGTPYYGQGSSKYTLWHSGNDGTGSGLDADLLDGQHASYFAAASDLNNYLPLSGGKLTGRLEIKGSTPSSLSPYISSLFINNNMSSAWTVLLEKSGVFDFFLGATGGEAISFRSTATSTALVVSFVTQQTTLGSGGTTIFCLLANGKLGINTSSPSYALHVVGDIYATGAVTCLSDIREKNILGQTKITVEQIARMPSIVYRWKDNGNDRDEHVGSIAQDWQNVLPQAVLTAKDEKKTLSMQYGVAALVSAITIARKVVDHERRIKELEDENRKLKEQLKIA